LHSSSEPLIYQFVLGVSSQSILYSVLSLLNSLFVYIYNLHTSIHLPKTAAISLNLKIYTSIYIAISIHLSLYLSPYLSLYIAVSLYLYIPTRAPPPVPSPGRWRLTVCLHPDCTACLRTGWGGGGLLAGMGVGGLERPTALPDTGREGEALAILNSNPS